MGGSASPVQVPSSPHSGPPSLPPGPPSFPRETRASTESPREVPGWGLRGPGWGSKGPAEGHRHTASLPDRHDGISTSLQVTLLAPLVCLAHGPAQVDGSVPVLNRLAGGGQQRWLHAVPFRCPAWSKREGW